MVRDSPMIGYGLNGVPLNSGADYGATDGFLALLRPGASIAGSDLQGCFLRCLVSRASRRLQGVRHLVTGRLSVYLFLALGLGPFPGWDDCCVKGLPAWPPAFGRGYESSTLMICG